MKIQHQLNSVIVISIIMLILVSLLVTWGYRNTSASNQHYELIKQVNESVSTLNRLTYEYLLNHEERIRQQWQQTYTKLGKGILTIKTIASANDFKRNYAQYLGLGQQFSRLTEKMHQCNKLRITSEFDNELCQTLKEQIMVEVLIKSQTIIAFSKLLADASYHKLFITIEQFLIMVLILALGLTVIITGFISVIARNITSGINNLMQVIKEFAIGNYRQHSVIENKNEFGELASNFFKMAHARQLATTKLYKLNRVLEKRVNKRTASLSEANKEITELNRRLKEENMRMSAELEVARHLQQIVLPKDEELQQIKHLDMAGFMEPAEEVGGDYYEVLNHDGNIKIGIGDVTGHGLESGIVMLMVQTTVRALLLAGINEPEHFLSIVNRTIYHNTKRMGTDKNLTLSLLDYKDGVLQLTGQHEEVLLVRKDGKIEKIDTFDLGFSIGIIVDITKFTNHQKIQLNPGDGIVLYTDGITEAHNIEKEQYGLDKLCQVVSNSWSGTAKAVQQAVINDVKNYIGTQKVFDDITLLVLKQK
ncbi:MAG: PP2C family protein-serine/threonine phosphatase [Candidatus Marithrix sp.]